MNSVKQGLLVMTALLIAVWFWLFADDRLMFSGLMIWILAVFILFRYDYVSRGKSLQQEHPDQQIVIQSIFLFFLRVLPLAPLLAIQKDNLYPFVTPVLFIIAIYHVYGEKFIRIDNSQIILQDRKHQQMIRWTDVIHLQSDQNKITIQSKNKKISIFINQLQHSKIIQDRIQAVREQYKTQMLDQLKESTQSFIDHEVQSDAKRIKWIGALILITVCLSALSYLFSKDDVYQFSQLMVIMCLFAFPFFWIRQYTNEKFIEHPVDGMVFLINADLIHFIPVMFFLVLGVPVFFLLYTQVSWLFLILLTLWISLSFWYLDFFSKRLVLSKQGIVSIQRQAQKMIHWDQITSYDFHEQGVFVFYKNEQAKIEQYSMTFREWMNSDLLAREVIHYLKFHQVNESHKILNEHQSSKESRHA